MVEFRRTKEGELYFMELNPRFWGTLPLAIASGVNFPALLIKFYNRHVSKPIIPNKTTTLIRIGLLRMRAKEEGIKNITKEVIQALPKVKGKIFFAETLETNTSSIILKILLSLKKKFLRKNIVGISENIFIGPAPSINKNIVKKLIANKIENIIDLREESEINTDKMSTGFKIRYFPIKDDSAPSFQQFFKIVSEIDDIISKGEKVYIHCRLGRGRAPTIAIGYLVHKGIPLERACLYVLSKKLYAILSPDQIRFLYEVESKRHKKDSI